ncbi:hypothetical protein PR048_013136 [Dryococelus australis]|uniref:Uncharacterized protein n=1 Tax=Dryococelus australis TaxID=614101 RepID=A0ABQ9HR86_9NEOP|nr:hypothetical protein PR048_013136 [Dryococelus australis]
MGTPKKCVAYNTITLLLVVRFADRTKCNKTTDLFKEKKFIFSNIRLHCYKTKNIYCNVSIPTVIHTRFVQMIKAYHDAYYKLRKLYLRDKNKDSFKKKMENLVKQVKVVSGIYFDGRKDKSVVQGKIGTKMYRRVQKEEHISLIHEPGGEYVGHLTLVKVTGIEIAKCILKYLEEANFDINQLQAIGCDGTAINTGWKNCVIRNIELPLRHLFEYLDGKTTCPASLSEKIGKQLPGCEKLPIVNFETVESGDINVTKTDLSKDLHPERSVYIRSLCKKSGPLSHFWWLTCANRVLQFFVSQTNPPEELKILAIRHQHSKGKSVRTFLPPSINFEASHYTELIY